MDYENVESNEVADITVHARSFSWTVDNMIKSETASILGESPVHSFTSLINSAIRSSSATEEDLGASPLHTFASALDNATSSSAAPFSQLEVVPNATRHVPARLFTWASRKAATNNFSLHNKIRDGGIQLEVVPEATRHVPARLFTWAELEAATNNYSLHNKIRYDVYRGKLVDGREVAINKRIATSWGDPFGKSEFAIFSRLDHRNLVGLVGYCENRDERLLVYEYMKNGSLRDCLQDKNNVDKDSSVLNSWQMRIKIAWDASRGIQYLHNYANPSIIHRDINSVNILLDATWTARVSDFGLSFKCPEPDGEYDDEKIVGTLGYMCPEYMRRGVLTAKCDVYGLGVVLLELLTGKTVMFNSEEDGDLCKLTLFEFAVRGILAGDLFKILDSRVGPPDAKEAEALEILAYTAICCVKLEGRHRPTMNDVVVNLERALAISGSSLYDENLSYSSALPSHDSDHMSPYPLLLEEFYTRRRSIPLSDWGIHTDSGDNVPCGTISYPDVHSCGTISDPDVDSCGTISDPDVDSCGTISDAEFDMYYR